MHKVEQSECSTGEISHIEGMSFRQKKRQISTKIEQTETAPSTYFEGYF